MRKYTCVILDDEPLAIEVIENYIQKSNLLELHSKHLNPSDAKKEIEINENGKRIRIDSV